jgi:uncharacterized protein YjiK
VPELRVALTLSIPLAEVSGLALAGTGDRLELLAVGDRTAELARAPLHTLPDLDWEVTRIGGLPDRKGSQLEAVAVSAEGRVVLLREDPPSLIVLDERARRVERDIPLRGRPDRPAHRLWDEDPSSRGEGLVLAADGRLLLAKEKRPPVLVELHVGEVVDVGGHWLLHEDLARDVRDISDLAVGPDHRLYLLSDQSSTIVRIADPWPPAGEPVRADHVWRLPDEIDKAEGLVILPDGRALVAVDQRKRKKNLFLLDPAL